MTQDKAIKHVDGWLYRGYLLDRAINVHGETTREWRINTETSSGDWEALDQYQTLRRCKEIVDLWRQS